MHGYGVPIDPTQETPDMYFARGLPGLGGTIALTIFFGVFGAILANSNANKARMVGLSGRRYWKAFWITIACNIAVSVILTVVLWLTVFAVATSYDYGSGYGY